MTRLTDINLKDEERKNNRIVKLMYGFGFVFLIFFVLLFTFGEEYDYCQELEDINNLTLNGIISEKIDVIWNHNTHGLVISDTLNRDTYLYLMVDRNRKKSNQSELWNLATVGDSIRKKSNDFFVYYKKQSDSVWNRHLIKVNKNMCKGRL